MATTLRVEFSRGQIKVLLVVLMLSLSVSDISSTSDGSTTTMTFPSPFAMLTGLKTTGSAGTATVHTVLAENPLANVGIGTNNPQVKLDVNGLIKLANYPATQESQSLLNNAPNGSLYYDGSGPTGRLRLRHNGGWQNLFGSGSLSYTNCAWIAGVQGDKPNWSTVIAPPLFNPVSISTTPAPQLPITSGFSVSACPSGQSIVGYHTLKSNNRDENTEYIFTPSLLAARRPNDGSWIRVQALCCNVAVTF